MEDRKCFECKGLTYEQHLHQIRNRMFTQNMTTCGKCGKLHTASSFGSKSLAQLEKDIELKQYILEQLHKMPEFRKCMEDLAKS